MANNLSLLLAPESVSSTFMPTWNNVIRADQLLICRYRNVYYHKQTKNTWARDDPALVLLQCGCLAGNV
jgi:hypothetical protein